MMSFLLWYLASSLLGLAVFPLAYRFMPALPDRGYAFSRALGLLLWGYLFWLLSSLHMVQNDLGGQVLALLVVLALSGLALRRDGLGQVRDWLASRLRLILTVEGVFLAAFALMALIRAASPDIVNTEKPMDMGFINSILRSPIFPPHDPWLSGYAISYYYFGHLLVAMMARITGTPGPVAFNLGLSLVFALAASGSYGVVYDLLAGLRPVSPGKKPSSGLIGLALLAPIFTLVLSNAGGFLQVMHQSGVFWDMQADGGPQSAFWKWLDIKDLTQPPYEPLKWEPANYGTGSWWWWRASRVVQDYTYNGTPVEIIDEFPAFSFLLADLHPHVLAMPFAFLGMALALNLLLGGAAGSLGKRELAAVLGAGWQVFLALGRDLGWIGLSQPVGLPHLRGAVGRGLCAPAGPRPGLELGSPGRFCEPEHCPGHRGGAGLPALLCGLFIAGGRHFTQPDLLHPRHALVGHVRHAVPAHGRIPHLPMVALGQLGRLEERPAGGSAGFRGPGIGQRLSGGRHPKP